MFVSDIVLILMFDIKFTCIWLASRLISLRYHHVMGTSELVWHHMQAH
jgi:hypothetical protein